MADLSFPAELELAQDRAIICTGYARTDGLWDIEAHLLDTKPRSVTHPKFGVPKPAGHPLHEMKIRITIDNELLIHDAEAVTIHAPFDACAIPPAIFPKLKGLSFNKGWKKRLSEIMGGVKGCTHLTELLGNLATVAILFFWIYYEALVFILGGEVGQVYTMRKAAKVQSSITLGMTG